MSGCCYFGISAPLYILVSPGLLELNSATCETQGARWPVESGPEPCPQLLSAPWVPACDLGGDGLSHNLALLLHLECRDEVLPHVGFMGL